MSSVTTKDDFICSACLFIFHLFQILGYFISLFLFAWIYLSSYWWLLLPYLYWIYVIDYDTPLKEGRILKCLIHSKIAKYISEYYPVRVYKSDNYELDPQKNYLFICAPHGVLGIQVFMAFGRIFDTAKECFPNHKSQSANISAFYKIPFYRDVLLTIGAGNSSAEAISYALTRPEGGRIVALIPGGAEESFYAWHDTYKIILKRRKGFVKIALKTGAPLVPVVCFNIVDDFDYQLRHPWLIKFQEYFKKVTYVVPIVARGRFGYTMFPKRVQCNLVGK